MGTNRVGGGTRSGRGGWVGVGVSSCRTGLEPVREMQLQSEFMGTRLELKEPVIKPSVSDVRIIVHLCRGAGVEVEEQGGYTS